MPPSDGVVMFSVGTRTERWSSADFRSVRSFLCVLANTVTLPRCVSCNRMVDVCLDNYLQRCSEQLFFHATLLETRTITLDFSHPETPHAWKQILNAASLEQPRLKPYFVCVLLAASGFPNTMAIILFEATICSRCQIAHPIRPLRLTWSTTRLF